jgi:hypothetical protein
MPPHQPRKPYPVCFLPLSLKILFGETGRSKRLRIFNPSPELRKTLLSIGGG